MILLFLFSGDSLIAQENKMLSRESNIISLNGSTSGIGLLFKDNGNLKLGTDSLKYRGSSYPAIQIAWDHFFKKKLSLGIIASTQSMNMEIDYMVFKNPNNNTSRFNNIEIALKRRYIGLRLNYHFINNTHTDLYMSMRGGAVKWKLKPNITSTDLDKKLETKFTGSILPSFGLGYKYKFNEKFGLGFELSVGTPQLFSYGIDYRF